MTAFIVLRIALNAVHVSSMPLQRVCALSLSLLVSNSHISSDVIHGASGRVNFTFLFKRLHVKLFLIAYVLMTGCISCNFRVDNRVNSVMITHRWSCKYVSVNDSRGIIRDDEVNQGFRSARDSGWFCKRVESSLRTLKCPCTDAQCYSCWVYYLSARQMFMWPVTSSNPSHDVITVDNRSSNLSSHTFVSRMSSDRSIVSIKSLLILFFPANSSHRCSNSVSKFILLLAIISRVFQLILVKLLFFTIIHQDAPLGVFL